MVGLVLLGLGSVAAPSVLVIPFAPGCSPRASDVGRASTASSTSTTRLPLGAGLPQPGPRPSRGRLVLVVAARVKPRWLASVRPGCAGRSLLGLSGGGTGRHARGHLALLPDQGEHRGQQRPQRVHPTRPATSCCHGAAHAAAGRGGGVLLPRLPHPGVRRPFRRAGRRALRPLAVRLAHGAQSCPVFFDRFAFGVVAGVLVMLTGGLEAGIACTCSTTCWPSAWPSPSATWPHPQPHRRQLVVAVPVTLTQSLVYLGLVLLVARRMGLSTRPHAVWEPILVARVLVSQRVSRSDPPVNGVGRFVRASAIQEDPLGGGEGGGNLAFCRPSGLARRCCR